MYTDDDTDDDRIYERYVDDYEYADYDAEDINGYYPGKKEKRQKRSRSLLTGAAAGHAMSSRRRSCVASSSRYNETLQETYEQNDELKISRIHLVEMLIVLHNQKIPIDGEMEVKVNPWWSLILFDSLVFLADLIFIISYGTASESDSWYFIFMVIGTMFVWVMTRLIEVRRKVKYSCALDLFFEDKRKNRFKMWSMLFHAFILFPLPLLIEAFSHYVYYFLVCYLDNGMIIFFVISLIIVMFAWAIRSTDDEFADKAIEKIKGIGK